MCSMTDNEYEIDESLPRATGLIWTRLCTTNSKSIVFFQRSKQDFQHRRSRNPIPFTLNMRQKLWIPILPYECKCQCNKVYDIYSDHPFNCPKNHKGRPHNMITNKFSQALAPLLTTANIISPTSTLDKETHLHLPADPTACPFDVSYKPNIDCHP